MTDTETLQELILEQQNKLKALHSEEEKVIERLIELSNEWKELAHG